MANPEQTTGLGEGDWGPESVGLGSLEGVAGGGDPYSAMGKTRISSSSRPGEEAASIEKKKPLNLLDLPVDVLKDIIKEVRGVALKALYPRTLRRFSC
jgi:hypothetical protein